MRAVRCIDGLRRHWRIQMARGEYALNNEDLTDGDARIAFEIKIRCAALLAHRLRFRRKIGRDEDRRRVAGNMRSILM